MWRRLTKPETLFFVGSVLAVSPYIAWLTTGPNRSYIHYLYEITFDSMYVWVAGYVAFWLGAKCLPFRVPTAMYPLVARPEKFARFCRWWLLIVALQILALIRVYSGIPLLAYARGEVDVVAVDELVRTRAFPGQLGIMLQSLFILNALLLIMTLNPDQRSARRQRFLFLASVFLTSFASTLSGKRQGLLITIFFVAVGLAIARRHPVRPILQFLRLPMPRMTARVAMIAVPLVLISLMGALARLRSGFEMSGLVEVARYVEMPLINLQTQITAAGRTPEELHPKQMLAGIVPARMVVDWGQRPVRAEPTSPAGFYGEVQWALGMPGVIVFAFLAGMLAKYFYRRAHKSLFHLLVYAQMAWTLFGACLYNHFLYTNFLWMPIFCFWLLSRLDRSPRRRRVAGIAVAPIPAYATVQSHGVLENR